uniref:Zinc finger, CCHC-type n=1 Tax=Tanacetum cinerariifolium TaxID=118510 RepID=A0A6L2N2Y4_TANCI|nr:zinc finger, CCHC-type [Tanacetum cinerariifolium]
MILLVLEDASHRKDEINKDNILSKPSEENLRLEPIDDEILIAGGSIDWDVKESLTMKDVLATLNSRELKKRTEYTKEETGDMLCVRERSNHLRKAHSGGSLRFKSRGETDNSSASYVIQKDHLIKERLSNEEVKWVF